MKTATALRFRGYVSNESTGHMARSTAGAMHFDVQANRLADVVLKAAAGNGGPRHLVNELVSAELAFRLGLPCPEPLLVRVPPDFAPIPPRHPDDDPVSGFCFALPYLHGNAPPSLEQALHATNASILAGIFVFDSWVANRDRTTPGNLIAVPMPRTGRSSIWMLDHGYTFGGPEWTPDSLAARVSAPAYGFPAALQPALLRHIRALDPWIATIAHVSDDVIADVVAQVPTSWLPDAEERRALSRYLSQRRQHLRAVIRESRPARSPAPPAG